MAASRETFELTLAVEGIYFGLAQRNCALAKQLRKIIGQRHGHLRWLDFYNVIKASDWGDFDDEYLLNQASEAGERLEETLNMFLQAVFATDVFAVMTLEAHINIVAQEKMRGVMWDVFDHLQLHGKWLYLPAVTGNPTFDPGAEPFQGFKQLIKRRNDLVHLKKSNCFVTVRGDESADEFLRLQSEQAEDALTLVRNLVSKLAHFMGNRVPEWATGASLHYYTLQVQSTELSPG